MAKLIPAKWGNEGPARGIIARTLNYDSPTAREAFETLYSALRDGDIEARVLLLNADGSLSEKWDAIPRSYWSRYWKPEISMELFNELLDHPDGLVEIDLIGLTRWLEGRRKPHRPRGTGMAGADASFVAEMIRLVQAGQASTPTDAAQQIIKRSRVPGGGTEESKVRRLVRRYKARTNGE
jgi:hypothetical protein